MNLRYRFCFSEITKIIDTHRDVGVFVRKQYSKGLAKRHQRRKQHDGYLWNNPVRKRKANYIFSLLQKTRRMTACRTQYPL
ncbi:hypothetical protein BD408DRAFT_425319 [Parasitella parasitica]|nr:hypothetical protein BD408DRAFT_425319 [Parasitella parasitica]